MTREQQSASEFEQLVTTYHRYGAEKRDADFWAWDRVGEIARGPDAERAWELVVALVRTAPPERLPFVGAGPLEDLITHHGSALADWIVGEAARDERFRTALARVWLVAEDVPAVVLARLQAVTGGRILVATQAELDAVDPNAVDGLPDRPREA